VPGSALEALGLFEAVPGSALEALGLVEAALDSAASGGAEALG
jgi:hypothetical protein